MADELDAVEGSTDRCMIEQTRKDVLLELAIMAPGLVKTRDALDLFGDCRIKRHFEMLPPLSRRACMVQCVRDVVSEAAVHVMAYGTPFPRRTTMDEAAATDCDVDDEEELHAYLRDAFSHASDALFDESRYGIDPADVIDAASNVLVDTAYLLTTVDADADGNDARRENIEEALRDLPAYMLVDRLLSMLFDPAFAAYAGMSDSALRGARFRVANAAIRSLDGFAFTHEDIVCGYAVRLLARYASPSARNETEIAHSEFHP